MKGAFRITDYFPSVSILWDGAAYAADDERYQYTTVGTASYWLYATQIDMRGWTENELTAFFANLYTQKANRHQAVGAVDPVSGGLEGTDKLIVSDVPLEASEFLKSAGFMLDASDYMSIKFMEGVVVVQTSNAPTTMTITDRYSSGSGDPTAAGTLYCYRILDLGNGNPAVVVNDGITYPELRFVAEGVSAKEPEWVHIDRLRRSYELANIR